jgi:uncharacterized protein involved in response to NO
VRAAARRLAHFAFAWLAVALALAALADVAAAARRTPGLIGRAPLHALGLGFFGGMLMAMVTRVTLGHSGRPLVLDALTWRLFLRPRRLPGCGSRRSSSRPPPRG